MNVPGATVRGAIKAAIDPNYNLSDIQPYKNPVSGIELLEQLGIAPMEADGFGSKAARFGLGLATDVVTDPLSFLVGGITKPLGLLRAPVFGKQVANLTRQGAAQPLLRGIGAGLKGTGRLGAALGDTGVLAARRAAQEAAGTPGAAQTLTASIRNEAQRQLTRAEKLGLQLGSAVRGSERGRGVVQAFSPSSLLDPEYANLQRRLRANISRGARGKLGKLDELVRGMSPADQKLVVDLLENSQIRAQYGLEQMRPLTGANVTQSLPSGRSPGPSLGTIETQGIQELPPQVRKAYEFTREVLNEYGNERLQRGLLASLLQNYFPHKLNPEVTEGALGAANRSTRQASGNFREIRKPLREIATDPASPQFDYQLARPLAREILESERAINVFDFFDEVKTQFGLTSEDLAARYGFTPSQVLPDEIYIARGATGEQIVDAARARANGFQISDDEVLKLVDFDALGVRSSDAMVPQQFRQGYGKLGKVYLPKSVADDMTRMHKAYSTDEGVTQFVRVWDDATNLWRPLVTTLYPAFHVNNFIGNLWNMYLGGFENPKYFRDAYDMLLGRSRELKLGQHRITIEQLRKLALEEDVLRGIFGSELSGDLYRLAREGVPAPNNANAFKNVFGRLSTGLEKTSAFGARVGSFVEGLSRGALFTDRMARRLSEYTGELTEEVLRKFAREAAEHTNKYLFDYAHGLSTFESGIMRRIAPFYSWSRFNIPRQIVELIDQPSKFLLYQHTKDNLTKLNPYPDEIPPWLREAIPTGVDLKSGAKLFLNPRLPLQDLSRLSPGDSGRELLGMLNPLIKLPIEVGTNQNLYTGRDITEYEGQTIPTPVGRVSPLASHLFDTATGSVGRFSKNIPQSLMPESTSVDTLRALRAFLPGLFTFDPQKQRVSNAYAEAKRLRDLLRKFEDEEKREVPTLKQLGL